VARGKLGRAGGPARSNSSTGRVYKGAVTNGTLAKAEEEKDACNFRMKNINSNDCNNKNKTKTKQKQNKKQNKQKTKQTKNKTKHNNK
jgi:hypothetical protein